MYHILCSCLYSTAASTVIAITAVTATATTPCSATRHRHIHNGVHSHSHSYSHPATATTRRSTTLWFGQFVKQSDASGSRAGNKKLNKWYSIFTMVTVCHLTRSAFPIDV